MLIVIWVVVTCGLVGGYHPEDRSSMFLRNVGNQLLDHTSQCIDHNQHLYDESSIKNDLEQEDTLLLSFTICHQEDPRKQRGTEI
jgi:hypothetical protein